MYKLYHFSSMRIILDLHDVARGVRDSLAASEYLDRKEVPMKHKVYTVFDQKAQVYMQPFYMRADGEAVRAFRASIAKPGHPFSDYPADYTLFGVGEYDDDTARFAQYDVFVNLGNGVQHLPKQVLPEGVTNG